MKKIILISIIFTINVNYFQLFGQVSINYLTERIIIVVVDGPRYSETWGDSTHQYIPYLANNMVKNGVVATNFFNDGYTYTTSGHTAICTGVKEELENSKGLDLPANPSLFQYYLEKTKLSNRKSWIITSKDKLFILGNSSSPKWNNNYLPMTDCGTNGKLSGYRDDITTFNRVMTVLRNDRPNLLLVNFKEPDGAGHANNWSKYLRGIVETDSLVWEIYKYLESDNYYKGKTTFIVTNDHGRHLDGWKDGFVSHGDTCEGCKHINLFAFGPDFKRNFVMNDYYTQVDLTATLAELLGLEMPNCQGKIIRSVFK